MKYGDANRYFFVAQRGARVTARLTVVVLFDPRLRFAAPPPPSPYRLELRME